MATYERHYCWSVLFRLFHWMLALSIVCLAITGFYINNPWSNTMIEGSASFPMATMRYIHFIAAYTLTSAVLIRLFLFFFGNAQERIWDLLPITKRNLNNLKSTLLRYSYIIDEDQKRLGHNMVAGFTYLIVFAAAVFMIFSGFYMLYPETPFWAKWGVALLGSQQSARFLHHLVMWWFLIFAFIHIYFCVWNDCKNPEGLISSIFSGAKFKHKA